MSVITVTRLLALICGIKSMRQVTQNFNTDEAIKNIANLLEIELEEIPHYDTINDVFETINIEELRKIQKYMVTRLIRSKMFDKYRYKEEYFQIVIDGTWLVTFKERHCKNCLKKTYNKGEESKGIEKAEKEEKSIKYWNDIKYGEVQFEKQANVIKYYEKKKDLAM